MKIRTVGALAALGMLFTSLGVRTMTREAVARPDDRGRPLIWDRGATSEQPGAGFSSGQTLRVEGRLGHSRLPARSGEETFILLSVRADGAARGREARRHLTILIDRSGSMQGRKLQDAIAAAQGAVRRLSDGDLVSVIDYSTRASVLVLPSTVDTEMRDRVIAAVARLGADGDTCISCALDESRAVLAARPGFVSRVLLLSDGEATSGVRDLPGMRRVAESVRNAGATVTTIGLGVDYNERMMAAIALQTNGRHHFAESGENLATIFDQELSGLEHSVARDARLELELGSGVEVTDLSGLGFSREGSRIVVSLGTFAAGEERTVLARVRVASDRSGEQPVAFARISYEDLTTGRAASSEGRLTATFTTDGSRGSLDPVVSTQIERSGTVSALNDANDLFQKGDAEAARATVAQKLAEVRTRRAGALAAAPAPKKESVARSFDQQEAALGQAADGFAEPPTGTRAAASDKAALKRNQAAASELAR
jgi:Ca-activated chloride channel family protein